MDHVSQIPKSCSTCFLDPLECPPAQHTALATHTGCFAVLILQARGCASSRCLTLPFKGHCPVPAASTQGGKAQTWPSWAVRTFPCSACAQSQGSAATPQSCYVSIWSDTGTKGMSPPATRPHLLSDTDGQFGRTVCTYAEMLSCPLTPHPSIMVDL